MVGSRLMARRADRPATLIAARRLSDDPRAAFRAISGLVLALFVTSTAVGVITTFVAERGVPNGDATAKQTVVADFSNGWAKTPGVPKAYVAPVTDSVLGALRSMRGVSGVTLIHTNPLGTTISLDGPRPVVAGLASCGQLAGVPGFGHCAAGADAALVSPHLGYDREADAPMDATTWPAAAISSERLRGLPVQMIMVRTDGSREVIEQVKTALVADFPLHGSPAVLAEHRADRESAKLLVGYKQLANVVILVSMCIAGCSLAVSVVGGLNDRKRPFSLLRLTGVSLGTLRRVVVLETAVPLLVIAAVAIGTGFLAAELFLKSQLDYTLRAPGAGYYLAVLAGLAASLGVIASTLPLLKRITGPETARNE
jgi:hypothetical protein